MNIKLAFSPCPNDTFIFGAMVHQMIDTEGLTFDYEMHDILLLNKIAERGSADVVKVSYNKFAGLQDRYRLLQSGSALGRGVGPLLIAGQDQMDIAQGKLSVAIPGRYTTANLLLSYYAPQLTLKKEMLFHEVMPAVEKGACDLGVIIHENRFTYMDHGLHLVQDLGAYWEEQTGAAIPLGGIIAKRSLGSEVINKIDRVLKRSVEFAFEQPERVQAFISEHAQEMDTKVMQAHIDLYVNDYSIDLGAEGKHAISTLIEQGVRMELYPTDTLRQFNEEYL